MIHMIDQLPDTILIGVQTETGVEEISINVSAWQSRYGMMDFSVWATRPGEDGAYEVKNYELQGSVIYWYPDETDTAIQGAGKVEIKAETEDKRKLSGWCQTIIRASSVATPMDPPGVAIPWLEEVKDAAEEAKKQADRAENIADNMSGGAITGSVRFDQPQQLTEEQKAQARANIGAGTGDGTVTEATGTNVHVGSDTPPENAEVWIDPEAEVLPDDLVGHGAVRYDTVQELTTEQKAQARHNLGLILLRIGEGLEIVDGVLRVTGTVTPPAPDEPQEPQMVAFVEQEDGAVLVQAVGFVEQEDGSILWEGAVFTQQDDGSYRVSGKE